METLSLLIVDDEMGMRVAMERTLEKYTVRVPEVDIEVCFDVISADTGERALEILKTTPPDILLLDHKLPGISGLDILKHLSENEHDLLTVMVTAYASMENVISATKRGAYDILAKPLTPDELKASVYKTAKHLMLQRQARMLSQEKRKVRFQFISILAHELKAPIAAVEQYLNILEGCIPAEKSEMEKQMIERSLVRIRGMRKLILDLLDLTRIESGLKKRELVEIDVCDIARAAIDTVIREAQSRGITIELNAKNPALMTADYWEIEVILNNLVSNAVKYNRDGGHVEVNIEPQQDRIVISISDTGIGISQEDAKKLFCEFGRIKNDNTEHVLGSGLGLSIVKKIALLYDSEVSLESRPGSGSTFTVALRKEIVD